MSQSKTGEALSSKTLRAEIERMEGLGLPQLRKRYREVFGKAASPSLSAPTLRRFIAQRLRAITAKVAKEAEAEEQGVEESATRISGSSAIEVEERPHTDGTESKPEPESHKDDVPEASSPASGAEATSEMPSAGPTEALPPRWIELGGTGERLYLTEAQLNRLGWVQGEGDHWVPAGGMSLRKRRYAPEGERDPRLPAPGSVLSRTFKGQTYEVEVLEKGFTCQGRPYRSLSALASELTGHPTNGFSFFGCALREVDA